MKRIVILGGGMVGRAMALDLCKDYEVTSCDISERQLARFAGTPVKTLAADLKSADEIRRVISMADLVIGAVPGFMGFEMAKTVIGAGKNIVDISFFNEDIFLLDALAIKNDVTAVMD